MEWSSDLKGPWQTGSTASLTGSHMRETYNIIDRYYWCSAQQVLD
jgi:hypothetical protein